MTRIRNQELLVQFGIHLRQLRMSHNLSQEKLANLADIPINQVGRIERGEVNPSLSTLHVIAKALNIEISDLVTF